ncbi:MAG TPA: MdtA/MuxA family multidrug efflux RND transporter periplasmic adaptor subunit [Thermoanaerobaculia bacterium]|nr:MdtA/MuxA family multidrug efflux RND transporter periplasmic adaptor subunit [Thermoanaerobaculia bacterium]
MISDPPEIQESEAPAKEKDRRTQERENEAPVESYPPDEPHSTRRRWWPWVLAVALVVVGAYFLARHNSGGKDGAAKDGKGDGGAGAGAGGRPVPVLAATAVTKDVGVYLTGLGTVAPLNTVTVKSRVDGQLLRINFQEGQIVRAGDVLAVLDPRPFQVQLMQAEGQKAKDEAALQNAKVDLQRYQILVAQDSIARQQLDTQAATVAQIAATIQSDQAQIESAKLNLAYSRVTAPTGGRVGLRQTDVGNIVHANDATGIVVITQLQPINVLFTIPADHLPQVLPQVHSGHSLAVDAYDRDLKNKLATGQVLAVDNQIDPTTGTVRIKALFPNQNEALFPNQFVNARLLVDTLRGAVTVPASAIQRSPQSTFVYLIKPDQTVETRNVEVQLTEGDDTTIRSGLAAGDRVVIDGADKLRPGSKVEVTQPGAAGRGQGQGQGQEQGQKQGGGKSRKAKS